jgi:hypothetical protein
MSVMLYCMPINGSPSPLTCSPELKAPTASGWAGAGGSVGATGAESAAGAVRVDAVGLPGRPDRPDRPANRPTVQIRTTIAPMIQYGVGVKKKLTVAQP